MPTENRSSNTEMVSVPPYIGLEPLVGRYYPAQCRRCGWVGSSEELTEDDAQCTRHVGDRLCLGDCDELERHDLLNIIQAMAQRPHPEPIAWMVGTAFWWTKEEAERDAAETGLPIVGLGPMAGAAPAEQHQGEPVAWRGLNELGEVVTDWIDGVPPSSMVDLCGNPASFASIEQAYTHTAPGEVERLREGITKHWKVVCDQRAELDTLREQLRLMTGDYRTAIVNGHERITFLGGDCDSVEKMLADNPNYAKSQELLKRQP
ncbi:hypothetical protein HP546_17185 [Pseudomonas sp. CM25]|uniref:hypothetical protein n=1 Tax=Pseudomonas sp. CM25 TaxID=2738448 RepID=UPI00155552E3|nr:hypothetical protein [Pseudomonas sp. CM25]NQD57081.1 hypothetical protein [Pseudomonas sp. CM25]